MKSESELKAVLYPDLGHTSGHTDLPASHWALRFGLIYIYISLELPLFQKDHPSLPTGGSPRRQHVQ